MIFFFSCSLLYFSFCLAVSFCSILVYSVVVRRLHGACRKGLNTPVTIYPYQNFTRHFTYQKHMKLEHYHKWNFQAIWCIKNIWNWNIFANEIFASRMNWEHFTYEIPNLHTKWSGSKFHRTNSHMKINFTYEIETIHPWNIFICEIFVKV